jgi:hypothetical protein
VGDVAGPATTETPKFRAADVVYDIIADKPGLKGHEIVAETEARGTPINERTVRTALFRLKRARAIRAIENGWHVIDVKPEPDPNQPFLDLGDDDGPSA